MKSIVLDKNILQGCNAADLAAFSRKVRIILPQILLVEIFTADPLKPSEPHWSSYFEKLKGCRFTVTHDLGWVFQEEKRTCRPARNIDDYELTHWVIEQQKLPFDRWQNPREFGREEYSKDFRDLVSRRRQRITYLARPELQKLTSPVAQSSRKEGKSQAKVWREAIEPISLSAWKENYPRLPLLSTRKSFSFMAIVLDNYAGFRRSSAGMGSCRDVDDERLFNEAADRDYLLNLIVKDGIVSHETWVRETAEAFFPGRLVWESLKQGIEWSG
jgi:hypothetical protein